MTKICYVPKNFNPDHTAVIDNTNKIVDEYTALGFDLTVRQIYYQFIGRDLFDDAWFQEFPRGSGTLTKNCQPNYKRLGRIINDARLAGLIDWATVVDRTRKLESLPHWDSPGDIIESAASGYHIDRWAGQEYHVEVWVEKDALAGVLEPACNDLDVSFFSCRGYTGQSAMWSAAMRLVRYSRDHDQRGIVIHLGDHDPSGVDMTRDIEERLALFCLKHNQPEPTIERIALNMDQILELKPPPSPAKPTDSRSPKYVAEYGEEAWELDALDPAMLDSLVREAIKRYLDRDRYDKEVEREAEEQESLVRVSDHWSEIETFLGTF